MKTCLSKNILPRNKNIRYYNFVNGYNIFEKKSSAVGNGKLRDVSVFKLEPRVFIVIHTAGQALTRSHSTAGYLPGKDRAVRCFATCWEPVLLGTVMRT